MSKKLHRKSPGKRRPDGSVKLVPFRPEHLDAIQFNQWDLQLSPLADLISIFMAGPAYSLFKNGEILAVGGVAKLWKGVGEAWAIPANGMKYPLLFHRTIKKMLDKIQEDERLHRVQAIVFENHPKGHRWVGALGFEGEGIYRAYGPNRENAVRYARIK